MGHIYIRSGRFLCSVNEDTITFTSYEINNIDSGSILYTETVYHMALCHLEFVWRREGLQRSTTAQFCDQTHRCLPRYPHHDWGLLVPASLLPTNINLSDPLCLSYWQTSAIQLSCCYVISCNAYGGREIC